MTYLQPLISKRQRMKKHKRKLRKRKTLVPTQDDIDFIKNDPLANKSPMEKILQGQARLGHIQPEKRGLKLCEIAMNVNVASYKYIPDNLKTLEMTEKWILQTVQISFIPNRFLTQEHILHYREKYDFKY